MNNTIIVTYNASTKRLVLNTPFHLVDAARSFPSRRFDPKTNTWQVDELDELHSHLYAFLSFITEDKIDSLFTDKIINGHVQALRRFIDQELTNHGGRFYNPADKSEGL